MTAVFRNESGMAAGNRLEQVAHMHATDRTPGTFQLAGPFPGEREHRPVTALPNARRNQPDNARMPAFVKQANAGRQVARLDGVHDRKRLVAHTGFNVASNTSPNPALMRRRIVWMISI